MTLPCNLIEIGDCIDTMRGWPDSFVQTCVTSPPYFGLRDYGRDGQIGLEATPDAFVSKLVEVFREVRRVLRDDGTLWLNLGDSYNAAGREGHGTRVGHKQGTNRASAEKVDNCRPSVASLKPKDLIGVPWRVAFALQSDGWYLRQDIIWHKPNPMPESVRDRCTKAHEYLFLLSKSEQYYCDMEAIKEPAVGGLAGNTKPTKAGRAYDLGADYHRTAAGLHKWAERQRSRRDSFRRDDSKRSEVFPGQTAGTHRPDRQESEYDIEKRNRRSVWTVATRPYKGAHFATFPPELIEPCILAGADEGAIVLDPFMGSGTVAQVALKNGRCYLGCELNSDYAALQQQRIHTGIAQRHFGPKGVRP